MNLELETHFLTGRSGWLNLRLFPESRGTSREKGAQTKRRRRHTCELLESEKLEGETFYSSVLKQQL